MLTFAAVAFILTPISNHGGFGSFPGYMLALAFTAVGAVGLATARIEVRGDTLHFVDFLTERAIPRSAITEVSGDNGVRVHLGDCTVLESAAYQSSVLQLTVPSSRYRRVAESLKQWALSTPAAPLAFGSPSEPRRRRAVLRSPVLVHRSPRNLLTRGLPIAVVGAQLLGVLLWSASPWLHPWVTQALFLASGQ